MEDAFSAVRRSYVELAELFGGKAPAWLPAWFEAVLIANARYDFLKYEMQPYRSQRRQEIAVERAALCLELETAQADANERLIAELTAILRAIEQEDQKLRARNGEARRGPNKSEITPQVLIAARIVEVFRYVNGRYPSSKNKKMAAALLSFLQRFDSVRCPIGDPLNGRRRIFKRALESSEKEIVIQRLLAKRSLEQASRFGTPWIIAGMNGPVWVYKDERRNLVPLDA